MNFLFFILIIVCTIYFPWFSLNKTLSSGDWPYLYSENIKLFSVYVKPPFLWLDPYYQLTAKLGVQVFSFSWEVTEKIFWFFPFLIISLIASYFFLSYLAKHLEIDAKKSAIFISLGCLIFTTNTYILMLTGGGQMGVVMAYSMIPLVLMAVFSLANSHKINIKRFLLFSLPFDIQFMFDPRIFVLSLLIGFLYILVVLKENRIKIFKKIIVVLILAIVINSFWILPNLSYLNTQYKSASDAVSSSYLSFATFSNSIALYHPNWPENIFGKIGFMKGEFIILSILAFFSLLFVKKNKTILFFAFLGLFGAFFAKGTNPPLGELYAWLSNFPGFSVFRDPTKFYVLVVLSYMVLIPFSLYKLSEKVLSIKYYVLSAFIFLVFWLFLIKPAILGNLTGTFKSHDVPKEYVKLKNFLYSQPNHTKTFWVPSFERFGFYSRGKPAISATEILDANSVPEILNEFDKRKTKGKLMDEEIRYVVVPDDYLKEIFLTDRKYDNKLYLKTVDKMKKIQWLSEIKDDNFGRIKVFEVSKF